MISAVIPTLNAAGTLAECLAAVSAADEIVVVDGGSSDETAAIAERTGARLVGSVRGRGAQLQSGVLATRGDWLLVLHADTILERGWREAVDLHIEAFPGRAAFFRLRLQANDWQARIIEAGVAMRARLFGLPYGDQGVLISRELYEAVGGYNSLPLMEDVDLIRRIGRTRLQALPVAAVTSAERWRRDGWLRRSSRNLLYLMLYSAGVPTKRLAELYD